MPDKSIRDTEIDFNKIIKKAFPVYYENITKELITELLSLLKQKVTTQSINTLTSQLRYALISIDVKVINNIFISENKKSLTTLNRVRNELNNLINNKNSYSDPTYQRVKLLNQYLVKNITKGIPEVENKSNLRSLNKEIEHIIVSIETMNKDLSATNKKGRKQNKFIAYYIELFDIFELYFSKASITHSNSRDKYLFYPHPNLRSFLELALKITNHEIDKSEFMLLQSFKQKTKSPNSN